MGQGKKKNLDKLINSLKKEFGGATIRRANELKVNPDRWSTGCLSLDYVLGGGIPRGKVIQFKGGDFSGKTTMSIIAAASVIRQGGSVLWVKGEDFDNNWARKLGLALPPTPEEESIKDKILEEIGEPISSDSFIAIERGPAEVMLDETVRFLNSGAIDLIVIDSISALAPASLVEGSMEKGGMGAQKAGLNNRFVDRVYRAYGFFFDPETGELSKEENAEPNETSMIIINQLRDRISIGPVSYSMPADSGGGWALRYLKRADVQFKSDAKKCDIGEQDDVAVEEEVLDTTDDTGTNGAEKEINTESKTNLDAKATKESKVKVKKTKPKPPTAAEKKRLVTYAKEITMHNTLSQICPDGRIAATTLYTTSWQGYKAGELGKQAELLDLACLLKLLQPRGAWYYWGEMKFWGREKLVAYFRDNPEAAMKLEAAVREKF